MVKVVTDSASDIPPQITSDLDISVVPATVMFGQKKFIDGLDLHPNEFYTMLTKERFHPLTSPAGPTAFFNVFKSIEDINEDILLITLPDDLSGFQESARIASKYIKNVSLEIISSGGVSMFQGLLVIQAAQMAQKGYSLSEIVQKIKQQRQRTSLFAIVPQFDYLIRGNRVPVAMGKIGGLLGITPLIKFIGGKNQETEKPKGIQKGIVRTVELLEKLYSRDEPLYLSIMHTVNPSDAAVLYGEIKDKFKIVEYYPSIIGPTIGANIGPGSIAVAVTPTISDIL